MAFCPICRIEFRDKIERCNECGVELVAELPPDVGARLELVEVYESYDQGEAKRIVALVNDQGIAVMMRDNQSSAFPTTVGTTGSKRVLVELGRVGEARGLIEAARMDEVISAEGQFLKS